MKVPDADRADPQHLRRPVPDLRERLVAHVPARDGHRDTRHHVAVGADVTGVVRGAARDLVEIGPHIAWPRLDWRRLSVVTIQRGILQDLPEFFPGDPQLDRRSVPVVLRRDHRVEPPEHPEAFGEGADLSVLPHVLLHERTIQLDGDPGVPEQGGALERTLEGARDLGDPVVDGPIGAVDADIDLAHGERPEPRRLFRRDQKRVGFQADIEAKPPRVLDQLEKILPQEDLAAAEREIERPGSGHVVEERLQLVRRQLRAPLDYPVAVNAPLVAAHGQVDLDGERDVPPHGLLKEPVGQIGHGAWAQDFGDPPHWGPTIFLQARAVVSNTSWLRISGGSYFRLPLWPPRPSRFRSSRFSMSPSCSTALAE